jgi:hypothetical protein
MKTVASWIGKFSTNLFILNWYFELKSTSKAQNVMHSEKRLLFWGHNKQVPTVIIWIQMIKRNHIILNMGALKTLVLITYWKNLQIEKESKISPRQKINISILRILKIYCVLTQSSFHVKYCSWSQGTVGRSQLLLLITTVTCVSIAQSPNTSTTSCKET